jgi:hypothetical protein
MMRWTWIAVVLALGCKGKEDPGPPCTKVADHVNEVVSKSIPGHGDMMPASSRKAWVASCEARKLTGKQRRCMLSAQSPEALAECMPREKTEDKKPAAPPGTPAPPPMAPAPTPAAAPASGAPPAPTPPAPAPK